MRSHLVHHNLFHLYFTPMVHGINVNCFRNPSKVVVNYDATWCACPSIDDIFLYSKICKYVQLESVNICILTLGNFPKIFMLFLLHVHI